LFTLILIASSYLVFEKPQEGAAKIFIFLEEKKIEFKKYILRLGYVRL